MVHEPELHLGDDIVVPDLAGWRRERLPDVPSAAYITLAPDWTCEVLSRSTQALDRSTSRGSRWSLGCWSLRPGCPGGHRSRQPEDLLLELGEALEADLDRQISARDHHRERRPAQASEQEARQVLEAARVSIFSTMPMLARPRRSSSSWSMVRGWAHFQGATSSFSTAFTSSAAMGSRSSMLAMQRGTFETVRDSDDASADEDDVSAPKDQGNVVAQLGFNLHASVTIAAHDDLGRERHVREIGAFVRALALAADDADHDLAAACEQTDADAGDHEPNAVAMYEGTSFFGFEPQLADEDLNKLQGQRYTEALRSMRILRGVLAAQHVRRIAWCTDGIAVHVETPEASLIREGNVVILDATPPLTELRAMFEAARLAPSNPLRGGTARRIDRT